MKIIITERQQSLITENLTEENLHKLCYQIWDKQRKMGDEPHLDDVIYDISGIQKNSRDDMTIIRPIWYEYSGGFNKLYDELKEDVLGKTFRVFVPEIDLDTRFRIVDIENTSMDGYKYNVADLLCDVDNQGTISFNMYDDETDEEIMVTDTIEQAYYEAMSAYETGDLTGALNYHIFNYLTKKLEKYGIPIDVELELKTFD
jgi:hypothetical protein